MTTFDWTDLDARAVDTARVLAADAVEKVGNGHPGTAMSLAPAAYLLFQRYLRHDPTDPDWIGRDRFVLSCGHSSLTLYIQLYLSGYGLDLTDLESFRTWGSRTPGHPEYGHTPGVETTTGPLGQGIATAVGMAMAARYEHGLLDPDVPLGESIFDRHIYVIASDGDLEEGISAEASSLAGTQELGNLTVIWDDNHISIEGDTAVAFTEDVATRYRGYGWHIEEVPVLDSGAVDVAGLDAALQHSRDHAGGKPVLIVLQSVIGWPAPHKKNTGGAHGAALGADEVAAVKEILGFDPSRSFDVEPEVLAHARTVADRGRAVRAEWDEKFAQWQQAHPDRAALLERLIRRGLPDLTSALPSFEAGKMLATRQASGQTINALAAVLPELWGGSADLAASNDTSIKGQGDFLPADAPYAGADPFGRIVHFGIREHAMGAALNGIALSGLTRPFGGTFLTFSDYMRGAVRIAALAQIPVIYVWTHDSIGLGEDGPTHQPVEHLWALRAMPGLSIVRPADAVETAHAWAESLQRGTPVGLVLTRQGVPTLDHSHLDPATAMHRGAYVLAEAEGGSAQVLLLATGSEVSLALSARELLQADGIATRVVSMPCLEWFDEQPQAYRDEVLPPSVTARVSIEAGATLGWWRYVGDRGETIGLDHFGASADAQTLFTEFGFTPERVVAAAKRSLARNS